MALPSVQPQSATIGCWLCVTTSLYFFSKLSLALWVFDLAGMFFLAFFLVGNFCPIFCEKSGIIVEGDSTVSDQINSTSLELEESLDCTTSSLSGNFSGCHSDEITRSKAVFIANAATVISIGAPANLITLLALPYVRLRWAFLQKQGQKLVLSDALAVQSQGVRVSRSKGFKS